MMVLDIYFAVVKPGAHNDDGAAIFAATVTAARLRPRDHREGRAAMVGVAEDVSRALRSIPWEGVSEASDARQRVSRI